MFKRSIIKKKAKLAFYRNWKSCVIISFLFAVLIGSSVIKFYHPLNLEYPKISINNLGETNNSTIVTNFIINIKGSKPTEIKYLAKTTNGLIGPIVNNVSKTGSYLFGLLNALNEYLFRGKIWASIIIVLGAILSFIYWVFISKVLEVGQARFFLENRIYIKTKPNKILLPYRLKKVKHIAWVMLLKNLYNLFWGLTIIGFFIKYYAYSLVPFILAENPQIEARTAIKLSRDLMYGHKWEMFKLDLSFIGWYILGLITFNVSNIVFTNPYMNATKAEYYMYLRDYGKTKGINNTELLKDHHLEGPIVYEEYPLYEYMLKGDKKNNYWLKFNYNRHYSIATIILLFFIFAIGGWLWEEIFYLFRHGILIKKGTLNGPWLPIYGGGGIAMLVLLKKYRGNPFLYFNLCMLISGIIEYLTSLYLELVHHLSWWDYSGYFLNLNGRICLEGLLLFAIAGVFITYILAPNLANILDKINHKLKIIICIILISLIAWDFYVSSFNPNTGEGITTPIVHKSK